MKVQKKPATKKALPKPAAATTKVPEKKETKGSLNKDAYAFTPEDENVNAEKFHFSVLCKMGDLNIPLQLDIAKDAMVVALKKKISDRTGGKLALNDMFLTMGANVLKRTMSVRQAGIKDNVQLVLTLKEDLQNVGADINDEEDMTEQDVAENLAKVGIAVPILNKTPEDKVSKAKKPYRNVDGKAKDRERFSEEETNMLIEGVATHGLGKWSEILTQSFGQSERSGVDLKDKWRNLCLAASRPSGFGFRVQYMTEDLLEKVREVKNQVEGRKKQERLDREGSRARQQPAAVAQAVAPPQLMAVDGDLGY